MSARLIAWVAGAAAAGVLSLVLESSPAGSAPPAAKPAAPKAKAKAKAAVPPTADEVAALQKKADALAAAVADLKAKLKLDEPAVRDRFADVAVHLKAAEWIIRHKEWAQGGALALANKTLDVGLKRAAELAAGQHPWTSAKGGLGRGYISTVDGSIQPYAVFVPAGLDGSKPVRLDVVLHGRDGVLTEVKHLTSHEGKAAPADQTGIVLHVFGRTNNAFRWAGETDVFEAIAAVKRNYRIDDRRIVLRGFSMGGAGAWHLGLHHPGTWVSVEAGAGFSETIKYAKQTDVPEHVRKTMHIYDAVDYALNAADLPVAGYGGKLDSQKTASANIQAALETLGFAMKADGLITKAEGIDFHRVVGAAVEHKVDPVSAAWLKKFHDERVAKGRNPDLPRIRFVTYTLKYNRCHWLTVEAMEQHYKAAIVDAEVKGDVLHVKAEGVRVLSVDRGTAARISFGGATEMNLSDAADNLLPEVYFGFTDGKWVTLSYNASRNFQKNVETDKRHGLQGPIDDAFTGPFLVVRGTGTPRDPAVQAWADRRLTRFAAEWDKWMRGALPVKNDVDVTEEDIAGKSLVLFGDPGSNTLIAKVIGKLPAAWSGTQVSVGSSTTAAAGHAPVLIAPNPLNPARYVVINSGHTFGAADFIGTNALLFPRLGDWAVFAIDPKSDGKVVASGFFNEDWK